MSVSHVKMYMSKFNRNDVMEFEQSSATVDDAAKALGVDPDMIAKTMAFYNEDNSRAILIVTSGLTKISSGKFKRRFGFKPRMIKFEEVEKLTGHQPGGVCPFVNPEGTAVYLDESLKKHPFVYPACGSPNSAIKLKIEELVQYANTEAWIDFTQD